MSGNVRYNWMDYLWLPEVRTNPSKVIEPTAPPVKSSAKATTDIIAGVIGAATYLPYPVVSTAAKIAGPLAAIHGVRGPLETDDRVTPHMDDFGNYYGTGGDVKKANAAPEVEEMVGRIMRARGY